jgi:hypothetical protein
MTFNRWTQKARIETETARGVAMQQIKAAKASPFPPSVKVSEHVLERMSQRIDEAKWGFAKKALKSLSSWKSPEGPVCLRVFESDISRIQIVGGWNGNVLSLSTTLAPGMTPYKDSFIREVRF